MTAMHRMGADVRVVGVGGAGGNALRQMTATGIEGATLIAVNTDQQALEDHPADHHIVLGHRSTRGLGAGGRAGVGFAAAQESTSELAAAVEGADLVFITAGMGGGTGTGAAPLVAHLAHDAGALVVGVVTMPFAFEGGRRTRLAEAGRDALMEQVDSLLVIENERLLGLDTEPSVLEAFSMADAVLGDGVRGIGDLVMRPGLINLDFADLRAVLADGGRAVMGMGAGRGPDRALHAVEAASLSPLLADGSIEGAGGVLMCFTVDAQLGLGKIHRAAQRVQAVVHDDAEILFGVCVDPSLDDEVRVTLCAAGLEASSGMEMLDVSGIREVARATPVPSARSSAPPASRGRVAMQSSARPYEPVVAARRNALVMLDR